MKKGILCLFGILATGNFALADTFAPAELTPELSFHARLEDGGVATEWTAWKKNFMWYKLSRSQSNANPIYPEDGAIFWSAETEETSFFDPDPPQGKSFYRVCAITHARERFCSNVVAIENLPESEETSFVEFCAQVITPARDPKTGKCHEFATPCDVPPEWNILEDFSCPKNTILLLAEVQKDAMRLSWESENSSNFSYGFRIFKSESEEKDAIADTFLADVNSEVHAFSDEAISPGETVIYRVCAKNEEGECEVFSNTLRISVSEEETSGFSDIDPDTEVGAAVLFFAKKGVIKGFPDGSFRPDAPVTRAELAKMAILALDFEPAIPLSPIFCDVPIKKWFAPFVHFFAEKGYAQGFEGNECALNRIFAPNNPVKRNEAIKMILKITGNEEEKNEDDWFSPYFERAKDKGILFEDRTDFREAEPATRGETMLFLRRAVNKQKFEKK